MGRRTMGKDLGVFANLFLRMTAGHALDQFDDGRIQLPLPGKIRTELEQAIVHIRWLNPSAYQSFAKNPDYSRLQTALEFY